MTGSFTILIQLFDIKELFKLLVIKRALRPSIVYFSDVFSVENVKFLTFVISRRFFQDVRSFVENYDELDSFDLAVAHY